MSAQPGIGEWYRIRGGDQFEVVAIDEDDGTIEVQYSDGTVAELDLGDWEAQQTSRNVEEADAPATPKPATSKPATSKPAQPQRSR